MTCGRMGSGTDDLDLSWAEPGEAKRRIVLYISLVGLLPAVVAS